MVEWIAISANMTSKVTQAKIVSRQNRLSWEVWLQLTPLTLFCWICDSTIVFHHYPRKEWEDRKHWRVRVVVVESQIRQQWTKMVLTHSIGVGMCRAFNTCKSHVTFRSLKSQWNSRWCFRVMVINIHNPRRRWRKALFWFEVSAAQVYHKTFVTVFGKKAGIWGPHAYGATRVFSTSGQNCSKFSFCNVHVKEPFY